MARDKTLAKKIETILYHYGVRDSGAVAQAVMDELTESGVIAKPTPGLDPHVTPIMGALSAQDHTGFMLRVFMHLVSQQPLGVLTVDLRDVLSSTTDRELSVRLDGPEFEAQLIKTRSLQS